MGNSNQPAYDSKFILDPKPSINKTYPLDVLVYGDIFHLFVESNVITKSSSQEYIHPSLQWSFISVKQEEIIPILTQEEEFDNISNQLNNKPKENVVVLYKVDSIFNDEVNDFIKKIDTLSTLYHPFIIFITSSPEETTKKFHEKYINDLCYFDIKNISIAHLINNNISEACLLLFKICSYYHELGDKVSLPPTSDKTILKAVKSRPESIDNTKLELIEDNFSYRMNFLIIGRPGAGKSTFINTILGEKRCKQMSGKSVTSNVMTYKHSVYPITLIDTPGMESDKCMDSKFDLFENLNKPLDKVQKEIIHMVIYVNSVLDERTFYNTEADFLKRFKEWSKNYSKKNRNRELPLIFVLTHGLNEKRIKKKQIIVKNDLKNILNENYSQYIFPVELVDDEEFSSFGMGRLFNYLYSYFKCDLVQDNIIPIITLLSLDQEYIIYLLLSKYTMLSRLKSIVDINQYCKVKTNEVIKNVEKFAKEISTKQKPFNDSFFANCIFDKLGMHISPIYGIIFTTEELDIAFQSKTYKGFRLSIVDSLYFMNLFVGIRHLGNAIISLCESLIQRNGVKNFFVKEIKEYNETILTLDDQIQRFKY